MTQIVSKPLKGATFSDIYVGTIASHMSGVPGTTDPLPIPDEYKEEVAWLRSACEEYSANNADREEFSIRSHDISYRVSIMKTIHERVFVARRLGDTIIALDKLGIPSKYIELMLEKQMTGLFVISGAFGQGKTTTASSLLAARVGKHGGVAVTVEDPPEMPLHGIHGEGICYQTEVRQGGFGQACRQASRWAPSILFLGEIRDSETAMEALRASINGRLVICTAHSENVGTTIERIFALATGDGGSPDDVLGMLATGLAAIVHQRLEPSAGGKQLVMEALFMVPEDESTIRSTIRQRKFDQLASLVLLQRNRILLNARRTM